MPDPKLYRPATGTEGEMFFNRFCYRCKHYVEDENTGVEDCDLNLIIAVEINDVDDPDYPDEWIEDENGRGTCTLFEKAK